MGFESKCSIFHELVINVENSKLNIADMWLIPLDRVTYREGSLIMLFPGFVSPVRIHSLSILGENPHFTQKFFHKLVFTMFLRGYCTSYLEISMFCALSQNYWHLFEKITYVSYSKLPKELKYSIKIKIGHVVLELLIQTTFWLFWSIA